MAEERRAKIDRNSAISLQSGQFDDPKFQVEGVVPTNHFRTNSWASECLYNFVADSFPTKKTL